MRRAKKMKVLVKAPFFDENGIHKKMHKLLIVLASFVAEHEL